MPARQPKVGQLQRAVAREQHVAGLQVAVHEAWRMWQAAFNTCSMRQRLPPKNAYSLLLTMFGSFLLLTWFGMSLESCRESCATPANSGPVCCLMS